MDNAVRAAGAHGTVVVQIARVGARASVEVADDGPGVPADQHERIFNRLVRLDEARSRDTGGAGLGLSIARGIARAHGGDLRSVPVPSGAAFQLSLPAAG